MNKTLKKTIAIGISAVMALSATSLTAFAATGTSTTGEAGYVNSVGSVAGDMDTDDLTENAYSRTGTPVTGNDSYQSKESEYHEYDILSDSNYSPSQVDVYATIAEGSDLSDGTDGTVKVQVPTVIILSGTADSNGYYVGNATVKAKGNIAGRTYIDIIPASTVTLRQTGKPDITASIAQDFTRFVNTDSDIADDGTIEYGQTGCKLSKTITAAYNANAKSNVEVKTNAATAGSWHGAFNYTITVGTWTPSA